MFISSCRCICQIMEAITYNKQLLDEAEYHLKNYGERGGCNRPRRITPSDYTKAEFNNCFIIH